MTQGQHYQTNGEETAADHLSDFIFPGYSHQDGKHKRYSQKYYADCAEVFAPYSQSPGFSPFVRNSRSRIDVRGFRYWDKFILARRAVHRLPERVGIDLNALRASRASETNAVTHAVLCV